MKSQNVGLAKEVIEALGLDCKAVEAIAWVKRKHNVTLPESTFYTQRDRMRKQAQEEGERQRFEQEQAAQAEERQRAEAAQRRREEEALLERQRIEDTQRRREQERREREAAAQAQESQRQAAAAEAEKLRAELHSMTPSQAVATRMLQEGELPPTPAAEVKTNGVTILVKAAKVLVARLGKEEAKQLIDAL